MPVDPQPAATLLLLRDGAAGLEVLMIERHRDQFFSGALVFPGGRVDPDDCDLARAFPVAGETHEATSFRIAAIRESWEEAGILLARRLGAAEIISGADLAPLRGKRTFANLVGDGGIAPATDLALPFAHWVTPEDSPRRYDTRFFLAVAPPDQEAAADGAEAVDLVWLTPAAALAEGEAKRRRLIFATRTNLHRLSRSRTIADAIADAARYPITRICPEIYASPAGPRIRIPPGLGYDLCDQPAGDRRHT
jgi:8-oxo-dGTP pyrophosphatase MutT (NUDIX family)